MRHFIPHLWLMKKKKQQQSKDGMKKKEKKVVTAGKENKSEKRIAETCKSHWNETKCEFIYMWIAKNVKWKKMKWNVKLKVKHLNRHETRLHETRSNMLLVLFTVYVQFRAHDLIEFCGWMDPTMAWE